MSSETLDEARARWAAAFKRLCYDDDGVGLRVHVSGSAFEAMDDLIIAERADAERVALSSLAFRAEIGRAVEQATRP